MIAPRALTIALENRARLVRNYDKSKRKHFTELCADPIYGDKLRRFEATLNTHFKITDAVRMCAYVEGEYKKWLQLAPQDFRYAALVMIDDHCIKLREKNGLPPFDDPLPGNGESVFFRCKRILGL